MYTEISSMTLAIIVTSTSFIGEDHFEQSTWSNSLGDHSTECHSWHWPEYQVQKTIFLWKIVAPPCQIWRWHVKCKTVLIRKVANFTEKDWCGLALTDWEVMLYKLNFILWEVMLTLMPLRAARLAAHKWHQIQSMGLFLAHHMNTKDWCGRPYEKSKNVNTWSSTIPDWLSEHFEKQLTSKYTMVTVKRDGHTGFKKWLLFGCSWVLTSNW